MLHVGISPGIFLLFCRLGMSVCDYSSLVSHWVMSCGASNSNPADSECVLRMIVIKEIKGHLRSHDVS